MGVNLPILFLVSVTDVLMTHQPLSRQSGAIVSVILLLIRGFAR